MLAPADDSRAPACGLKSPGGRLVSGTPAGAGSWLEMKNGWPTSDRVRPSASATSARTAGTDSR